MMFQPSVVLDIRIGDDATLSVAKVQPDQYVVALIPDDEDSPEILLWQCDGDGLRTIGDALKDCA